MKILKINKEQLLKETLKKLMYYVHLIPEKKTPIIIKKDNDEAMNQGQLF